MQVEKILRYLFGTNWFKTIRINFHYFPFRTAIKFPIFVAYRTIFQELRGGVIIAGPVYSGMIMLGYRNMGTQDPYYDRTIWQVSGSIVLKGKRIGIGRGSKLCVSGECTFGEHFLINGQSTIICHKNISFGTDVLLSWDVLIMDTDYHTIVDERGDVMNNDKNITIGDKVWIGCRSTILKGTVIPPNSIIAAGSTISGKMDEERCIYTSENRILRHGVSWEI